MSILLFASWGTSLLTKSGVVAAFSLKRSSPTRSFLHVLSTTTRGAPPTLLASETTTTNSHLSWQQQTKRASMSRGKLFAMSSSSSEQTTVIKSTNKQKDSNNNMGAQQQQQQEEDAEDTSVKTIESKWNVAGLKKEVGRQVMRSFKKLDKASTRLENARQIVEQLLTDPEATDQQLEQCPNVQEIELEVEEKQHRHEKLIELEEMLGGMKSRSKPVVLPEEIALLALELDVADSKPPPQPRGPKKQKGPKTMAPSRLPYRRYYTSDETEIRVGKQAADNDELSCSPQHRNGSDWWMHASGCPGSHVVIRSDNPSEEALQDAAALAARQSKCASAVVVKVNVCRCRDVKKPPGAKPGLVQLVGNVRTISVNMKKAEKRLTRLDETVLVN